MIDIGRCSYRPRYLTLRYRFGTADAASMPSAIFTAGPICWAKSSARIDDDIESADRANDRSLSRRLYRSWPHSGTVIDLLAVGLVTKRGFACVATTKL